MEALWTEAISGALKRQFPKLPNVSVTAEDVAQSENRPLEAAVGAIVSTAVATAFAGFASASLHCAKAHGLGACVASMLSVVQGAVMIRLSSL